jgi:spore coat protein CotH
LADWTDINYDDGTWLSGQGGIGYGDDDDGTVIGQTQSVYMRQVFTISEVSDITSLSLFASLDDGFVAYLNGVEIARENIEGIPPPYTASTITFKEAELPSGQRPLQYFISSEQLVNGENILAVQTHNFGEESSDLSSNYWLIGDVTNDVDLYLPLPDWYETASFDSNLPIIKVVTQQEIVDEPKVDGSIFVISNEDGSLNNSNSLDASYVGNISIEKRGESSLFFFPKNGYGFETKDAEWEDVDVELLGFPEEEDWILHGPYSDKTFLRNILVTDLARKMGQYASRTQPVELIINNSYQGIYILMERIKRDKNRVDVANLKEIDTTGVELTGGYVFKVDKGTPDWLSQYDMNGIPGQKVGFQYVSPKATQIHPLQEAYIQSFVDSMETALQHPTYSFAGKSIEEYIDLETFADHYIISELTRNVDAFRISTYLHKEKDTDGGLIKMGPVWDYNIALGNADYCDGWDTNGLVLFNDCSGENPFWWYRLVDYPPFDNLVKCRYQEHRATILQDATIEAFVNSQTSMIGDGPRERDDNQWNILGNYAWPNFFVGETYDDEVNYLLGYVSDRLSYLDTVWGEGCEITSTDELQEQKTATISPNPASDYFTLLLDYDSDVAQLILTDITGKIVLNKQIENRYETMTISQLTAGIYIGRLLNVNGRIVSRFKLIAE